MALIRCPECGNMFSNMAANCPKCGCPVRNADMQQNGGGRRVGRNNEKTRVIYKKKNDTNKWLYAAIALLASILLGGGAYYFLTKNKAKDTPTTEVVKGTPADTPADTPAASGKEEPNPAPTPTKQDEPTPAPTPTPKNKVADGTYRLNGSITYKANIYYFNMEIHVNGSKVTGWHIVNNGENIPVDLSGSIDANGNMKLTEYKGGGKTGYYYTGNFNQVTYSGKYLCTYQNLPMRFSASTY